MTVQHDRQPARSYFSAETPQPAMTADGLDAPYWEGARRHTLMVQRCADCETYQWEPEWICRACQSAAMDWVETPPRGRVYSWTRVWHPVHPGLVEAIPYLVVIVELPEAGNVRMCGNLLGDPHQDVHSGDTVVASFEDHADKQYTLVQWIAGS